MRIWLATINVCVLTCLSEFFCADIALTCEASIYIYILVWMYENEACMLLYSVSVNFNKALLVSMATDLQSRRRFRVRKSSLSIHNNCTYAWLALCQQPQTGNSGSMAAMSACLHTELHFKWRNFGQRRLHNNNYADSERPCCCLRQHSTLDQRTCVSKTRTVKQRADRNIVGMLELSKTRGISHHQRQSRSKLKRHVPALERVQQSKS